MRRKNTYLTRLTRGRKLRGLWDSVGAGGPLDALAKGRVIIVGLFEELAVSTNESENKVMEGLVKIGECVEEEGENVKQARKESMFPKLYMMRDSQTFGYGS